MVAKTNNPLSGKSIMIPTQTSTPSFLRLRMVSFFLIQAGFALLHPKKMYDEVMYFSQAADEKSTRDALGRIFSQARKVSPP